MLVYLTRDRDRIEELERSVREYLGWSEILAKEDDLGLTTSQRDQATERRVARSANSIRPRPRCVPMTTSPWARSGPRARSGAAGRVDGHHHQRERSASSSPAASYFPGTRSPRLRLAVPAMSLVVRR
jgi:hypothetical protein